MAYCFRRQAAASRQHRHHRAVAVAVAVAVALAVAVAIAVSVHLPYCRRLVLRKCSCICIVTSKHSDSQPDIRAAICQYQ